MNRATSSFLAAVALCCSARGVYAQSQPAIPASELINRSITAIGYQIGGGATTVDLKSTGLIAQASGQARVEAKPSVTIVQANIQGLSSPIAFGAEFLTYVLWAVSPEGRATNVGEVLLDKNGNGKLKSTTPLRTFSLFLTAEPYSAVRQPSEMLILENQLQKNTKGKIFIVNDYKLMKRSQYEKLGNPLALSLDLKNVPLQMYEARNAVEIAKSRRADKYAPNIFSKAEASLKMAEIQLTQKGGKDAVISASVQTEQFAEDARALSVERQEVARIESERAAAAAAAKAAAEAKAATAAAEAKRQADEQARQQAELAAAREAQMQAQAELAASKAQAQEDALKAKADQARQAAEQLRAQLLEQLNRVLATRDTPRGLVVTMGDVLFHTGKYDLPTDTREMLSRLSGIVLAHPGLNLAIGGYTDNTGTDALNQRLSQQRADTVRDYLITQGLTPENIISQGYGDTMPVTSNDTAAGRQQNRRVELIVSGQIIGIKI